jgi:hypothetical protein
MMKNGAPLNDDRVRAQFEGRKWYHGKPCKNCQTTEKYVENYLCRECAKRKARERAQAKRIAK